MINRKVLLAYINLANMFIFFLFCVLHLVIAYDSVYWFDQKLEGKSHAAMFDTIYTSILILLLIHQFVMLVLVLEVSKT